MTIAEMHIWFRQYAQQMGMQNVRAILPEQIDLLINTSITDTVNEIIAKNIGVTNDRVITDNSKIGQINALKGLYRVSELPIAARKTIRIDESSNLPVKPTIIEVDKHFFEFEKKYKNIGKLSTKGNKLDDSLFIVDFAISYKKAKSGFSFTEFGDDDFNLWSCEYDDDAEETNYFPVRLIDDAYLADTLNDFILAPRLRTPIIVNYNNNVFDLYIERFIKDSNNKDKETYILPYGLIPYMLRFSYIAKPKKVKYAEDLTGDIDSNVDCDLPEYLHVDILKHAVDLYRIAVSGSLHAAQQQEQAAQQENMRNNYRNEGAKQ